MKKECILLITKDSLLFILELIYIEMINYVLFYPFQDHLYCIVV